MAQESVLLKISLDSGDLDAKLTKTTEKTVTLKNQQKELQGTLKELTAANKQGTEEWETAVAALARVQLELKATKAEQKAYEQAAKNALVANNLEEGSLVQKRAALRALQGSYDLATTAMKQNDEGTKQLGRDIVRLRREISDEEQQLGIFFRNVGNYPKSVALMNDELIKLNQTISQTAPESEEFKKLEAEISSLTDKIGATTRAFDVLSTTVDGAIENVGDLEDKLNELNKMLKEVAIGSTEYARLQQEIRKTKVEIEAADNAFGKFGVGINRTARAAQQVATAFSGGVAAFQLFNVIQAKGNEQSEEMLKVMRSLAIVQAAQAAAAGVSAAVEVASNAAKAVKVALMSTEIAASSGLTAATFAQAAAQAVLNAVMNANPVFLIITGILALVGAFALFMGKTRSAAQEQKLLNDQMDLQITAQENLITNTESFNNERLNLMKSQGAKESQQQAQAIADFDQKNTQQRQLYSLNLQKLEGLRKLQAATSDVEKKKEYAQQIAQQQEALQAQLTELNLYGMKRQAMLLDQAKTQRDEELKMANLRVAAMADGYGKSRAALKVQMEQELSDITLTEEAKNLIRQKYANEGAKLAYDYRKRQVDAEIAVELAATREGTEANLRARIDAIQKARDIEVKAVGLSKAEIAAIEANAAVEIRKVQEEILGLKREFASQELEIRRTTAEAELKLQELNAVTIEEKSAAKLARIGEESQREIDDARLKAAELKKQADLQFDQSVEGREQYAERVRLINEQLATQEVEIARNAALQARDEAFALANQQRDDKMANLQMEIDAERLYGDERLANQQELLNLQEEKEIKAAEKSGKSTLAIRKKYATARQLLEEETLNQQLSATSKVLGDASKLFGEKTAAYRILASAQALIDTYVSANAAYKSTVGIPVVGATLAPIAAGVAVATGLANVAKINQIKFYEGGYTGDGDPRSESTLLGRRPYIYHKREYITPAWLVDHPIGGRHVAALESMRRTRGVVSGNGSYYLGGMADSASISRVTSDTRDMMELEMSLTRSISAMPNPIVLVEDINAGQSTVSKVVSRASI